MAMDLAAINPLLKDEYEDYVADLVHTDTTSLDLFTQGDVESADGRRVIIPAHLRRDHAGVGFVGEGGQLPTPNAEQAGFFSIPFRKSAARFQITKETIDQAQTSRGSFVRSMQFVMDHLVENLIDVRNKAVCHYGDAVLGKISGNQSANATTITVKDPGGVVGTTNASRFLQVGQNIAVLRNGAMVANTPLTVTGVAPGANYNQVTVAANTAALNDGDLLTWAHSSTATLVTDTSYKQAPMGFLGMIDDGTYVMDYFGINRGTWDVAKSYVFSNTGPLSSDIFQQGIDVAYSRGRGKISRFLMEHAARRAYLLLREGDVRYQPMPNPDAGTKAGVVGQTVTWANIDLLVDYNFPYGVIVGIDDSTLIRYTVVPGKFEDWGGSVLLPASGTHTATGLFYIFDNFMLDAPNKCIRFDGVDVNVTAIHVE